MVAMQWFLRCTACTVGQKNKFCSETPKGGFCIKWPIGVSEENLLFCPTVQVVHLKKHCIATIIDDQKYFQHNQDPSTLKARFFKSDANSDFDI